MNFFFNHSVSVIFSDMTRTQAEHVMDQRVVKATKKNYESSIKKFKKWLKVHHPFAVTNADEVIVPLQDENVILEFLGAAQRMDADGNVSENGKLIAVSTMVGIGSAINDLYRGREQSVAAVTKTKMQNFMRAYKRIVSEAKQKGEMKIFEGKRHLSRFPFPF